MVCLLRHWADFETGETKPHSHNESVAADLSRLKYYRNIIVHSAGGVISDDNFNKYFAAIREVCFVHSEKCTFW